MRILKEEKKLKTESNRFYVNRASLIQHDADGVLEFNCLPRFYTRFKYSDKRKFAVNCKCKLEKALEWPHYGASSARPPVAQRAGSRVT